ncbi:uncharacterized protein PFL1_00666 [Pseudozyma flocculosa PF-1]|uniref:uncharacterized protein n=1 Tax=Pseudozyma flocculosa PF-1 TaxID=1277687 RepID=UPI0004560244|nr:uncharacterized protein PFL1_00666 [Pseudozyma flocculosa PF-1]EPQ32471.1 hypothetical protein PFL1_00666 [Pseudozyma flocculosa PF-1]
MYRSITPQVSMPQHSIFGEAVTVTSATSIKKQKQTNPAKAAANNNNNNSNSNSAPKRSEKMAQPKRITSPLFNMAETAANAIFTYDELEPSEEAKKKSEAALAALIDLAVDHWKSKHRQASTAFDKQVNDYLRATESACNDACRRAEERW